MNEQGGETPRSVAVAVLTYQRPDQLATVLPELARQAEDQTPSAEVLVVDNDPDAAARPIVESLHLDRVRYVHEPRPGIAAARNAALHAAAAFDVLVFIDDDETPDPEWLATLLRTHARLGGAALAGPVLRTYEHPPAPWIRATRVMDRKRLPTGTRVEGAATNNLLLSLPHVRRHGLLFDDELGLAGGSDSLFTTQLHRCGGTIYWCDEAVVREFVPRERLTARWTLRRGYRAGNTAARIDLMLAGTAAQRALVRIRSLGGGLARLVVGGMLAAAGVLTADADRAGRGAWTALRGTGFVGGAFGHRLAEYRRGDAH